MKRNIFTIIFILFFTVNIFSQTENMNHRRFETLTLSLKDHYELHGLKIQNLSFYSYDSLSISWIQIPFQIDQKDSNNKYIFILAPDSINERSELSLLLRDFGDKAPIDSWVAGTDSSWRQELVSSDTADATGTKKAWTYLYYSEIPNQFQPEDYVDATEDMLHINSLYYQSEISKYGVPHMFAVTEANGGINKDFLDVIKFRVRAKHNIPFVDQNIVISEADFTRKNTEVINGPVRVILKSLIEVNKEVAGQKFRDTFDLLMKFNPYNISMRGDIDISQIDTGIPGVSVEIKSIRVSMDLKDFLPLEPERNGLVFYNKYNRYEPEDMGNRNLIDGAGGSNLLSRRLDLGLDWFIITGQNVGSICQLTTVPYLQNVNPLVYFWDNAGSQNTSFDNTGDAIGDRRSYGDSGQLYSGDNIKGSFKLISETFLLPSKITHFVGDTLSFNAQNPVQTIFISEIFLPVELASLKATALANSVEITWVTASEQNNYGFDIERRSNYSEFVKVGFVEGNGTVSKPNTYSFIDRTITQGVYYYRLRQIDFDGQIEYSASVKIIVGLPKEFALHQNYPNPFNPETTIEYFLPSDGIVNLAIYNISGAVQVELVNGSKKAGKYTRTIDASLWPSGLYIVRLSLDGKTLTKKINLIK
jgi:hypothetical protein